ncbi:DeoR/GlpR family DNA-binding transcription regulator [Marinococcus halophilus]|uniref:DeoR/GlpR family DNA-binding transcription regulator n=1 Tax=Marinococcus halophilus TaxID=1371 RepID=UPI0009A63393|nr:DeoR/GlpR family DNA-binding transcription regulator [Marinococcus halophilus]
MMPAERLQNIKNILLERKSIKTNELKDIFNVSTVTIRKDLNNLENQKFLQTTFGGAVLLEQQQQQNQYTPLPSSEASIYIDNEQAKEYIASLALSQIQDGDTIFLGSGSTCYLLAHKLKEVSNLTVVTNNINALSELVKKDIKVFFIGGEIVNQNGMISTSSEKVDNYFQGIYVNKAFTSVTGMDFIAGLTVNHIISTYIYKKIQEMSSQWFLMLESTKFYKRGIHQVAKPNSPDFVISDNVPQDFKNFLEKHNVKVIE